MKKPEIKTLENLEKAFAGESMAHMKYTYFAQLCRKMNRPDIAEVFEKTAKDEIAHAIGHLRFLFPEESLTPEKMLELSIQGETYEYTEMYPSFAEQAKKDNDEKSLAEIEEQIKESQEHAENFKKMLPKLEKLFNGLAKVEKAHADLYKSKL